MTDDAKRFTNLQARAALAGIVLQAVRNDYERWTLYATAGAVTQELASHDEAERWLAAFSSARTTEGQGA